MIRVRVFLSLPPGLPFCRPGFRKELQAHPGDADGRVFGEEVSLEEIRKRWAYRHGSCHVYAVGFGSGEAGGGQRRSGACREKSASFDVLLRFFWGGRRDFVGIVGDGGGGGGVSGIF